MSCYLDKINITKLLLEFGSDINELDLMGNSALIGVSFKGNLEIVKLLVDNKAKLDIQNNSGSTALIYSAMYKNKDVYNFLIISEQTKS